MVSKEQFLADTNFVHASAADGYVTAAVIGAWPIYTYWAVLNSYSTLQI